MSTLKLVLLIGVVSLTHFNNACAQNTRVSDRNSIGWFAGFTTLKLSNKWGAHLEYQWRRENLVKDWQQSLLRLGVNYQVSNKVSARMGYAWIETFPYGAIPLQAAGKRFPEHRTYQMIAIADNEKRIELNHRFILEQRWVGRYSTITSVKPDDFVFLNRLRYMFRMQMAFNKNKLANNTPYAAVYDELMIGFGKNINENIFDQNRLGIVGGFRFNKKFRIEGGYLQQVVQLGREVNGINVFQYNNGLIINSFFSLDLSKNK